MKRFRLFVAWVLTACVWATGCTGSGSVPINVVSREEGSGTRGAFIELFGVEVKQGSSKMDMTTKEANIVSKTDVMLTSIANDKNAVGYVSLGSLNDSVKALKINGVAATAENIKNGTYIIKRPFNIATKGTPSGLTADFIRYILSAEGQQVVGRDYVPVAENAEPYSGDKPKGTLVIAGSSSVSPVMEKLAEAYKNINPQAVIEIQVSDSSTGMQAVIDGNCDIGMASRDLKESEKASLTETAVAIDGIAVIVSNNNPLTGLTQEEVRQIFTGEVSNWSDLNEQK